MILTKKQLNNIIKEELAQALNEEADEQQYGYINGEKFKLVDTGNKFLMISCGGSSCRMLGRMEKGAFEGALAAGKFKKL